MTVELADPAQEVKRLQRCINDLVSVLALPAVRSGGDPRQVLNTFLDALMRILAVDFLYARLTDPVQQDSIEAIRVDQLYGIKHRPDEISQSLNRWFGDDPHWPGHVRDRLGGDDISVLAMRLGLQGELGAIFAGSERANFPLETERLILNVAANQAAVGLQQACLLGQQRSQGRAEERMRIARDLHDTLLQSFLGLLMKASAVKYLIRNRPSDAEEKLDRIIEEARQAITEGRDAVQGLRSSTAITNDLAQAITTFGKGVASEGDAPKLSVIAEGDPRELSPLVRDEVFRIASESLRNAFRYATARRVGVEIYYDNRELRVRVWDDGKGIAAEILEAGGRAGHHGMPGMRERAKLVGGTLTISSELDSGTQIEITIPAALAYVKASPGHQTRAYGQGS
jgi:signal transduction histidine kinase